MRLLELTLVLLAVTFDLAKNVSSALKKGLSGVFVHEKRIEVRVLRLLFDSLRGIFQFSVCFFLCI